MARKRAKSKTAGIATDLGTPETRRRCTPDPLLSTDVEVHRVAAGIGIRMALEEGLDPSGLDMIQIGLGGGSTGYNPFGWTPKERLMEARYFLGRWRDECRRLNLRSDLAEAWACGSTIRQVAAGYGLNRPRATEAIHAAIDLYADMRGYRKVGPVRQRIAVWEHPDAQEARDSEGLRATLRNRAVRGN